MVETRSVRAGEGKSISSSQLPRAPSINNPWLHKDDKAGADMNGIVDRLLGLMAVKGARQYGGERVSQCEHALQCASLAARADAPAALIAAALLHALGHLLPRE